MSETEKKEKEIYTVLLEQNLRAVLGEKHMNAMRAAFAPLQDTEADVAAGMLFAANLNEDDGRSVANAMFFDVASYLKDGRVLELVATGAAASCVSTDEIVERAAAGTHVYFQSIATRVGVSEWANALEMSFFNPDNVEKNADFEFYIGCMPPGGGTIETPAPEGAVHYITVGVPIAYKDSAILLADEFQLCVGMEGAGVGIVHADDSLSLAVQWNPDKPGSEQVPEGMYITPLRGLGIYQVTNTSDSGVYANAEETHVS